MLPGGYIKDIFPTNNPGCDFESLKPLSGFWIWTIVCVIIFKLKWCNPVTTVATPPDFGNTVEVNCARHKIRALVKANLHEQIIDIGN